MYPQVRGRLPDLEDDILESYEEHHVADVLVVELSALKPGDERFEAKTTVLIENVTHHMDEEEQDWFPKVREGLSRPQLRELGAQLEAAKQRAPRKPSQPSALKKTIDRSSPELPTEGLRSPKPGETAARLVTRCGRAPRRCRRCPGRRTRRPTPPRCVSPGHRRPSPPGRRTDHARRGRRRRIL